MKRLLLISLASLAFALACGKTGVFKDERFACATSGECADGYTCVASECQLASEVDSGSGGGSTGGGAATGGGGGGALGGGGGSTGGGAATGGGGGTLGGGAGGGGGSTVRADAGVACTSSQGCLAGLTCVDGVCCTSACNGLCDSCNQAGFEGTCRPKPAGAIAPLCSGYACDGQQTACATTCAADAGFAACNPTFVCLGTSCARCWSAATSDFSVNNDPNWTLNPTATVNIAAGKLSLGVQSTMNQTRRSSAMPSDRLPFSGCGVTFELVTPPTANPGTMAGYVGGAELAPDVGGRPSFGWRFADGGVFAAWALSDGGVGERLLVASGSAMPRWLRVEESGGELRWRTTSTTTFTTVHSVMHGETLPTSMRLEFYGALPPPNGTTVTFEVDNLNLGP